MNLFLRTLIISIFPLSVFSQTIHTKAEQTNFRQTPGYHEIIKWWKNLDARSNMVSLHPMGSTDAGYPLHLVIVSAGGRETPSTLKASGKLVILVNNGIHPGEPDGIDASMMLVRDIVVRKKTLPENVVLAIIPVYNIGGCLNRSPFYRVDQNGPDEFGSRGNSQNYDLNRDFIKSDTREARSFAKIFQTCDPDIFIDNHVSNGADYQHVMTLLSSQHNKLGGEMSRYMEETFEPALYESMHKKGFDLVPYVNNFSETPETGWSQFFDAPRYSSGYATLFHTFGFTPETHMLKPYEQRVKATYALMESFIAFASANDRQIQSLRQAAKKASMQQRSFPIAWKRDTVRYKEIEFKGYSSGKKNSNVSGLPRLYYDRGKPFVKKVPFYNVYVPSDSIERPHSYVIPQGWWKVIELLKLNNVVMHPLNKDSSFEVEYYTITDLKTLPRAFEGHHLHTDVRTEKKRARMQFRKGDIIIPMNQLANRFVVEVLEPRAMDSYFAWNFFDPILGQKEGFSSYVFEDTAEQILKNDPELRQKLEQRKSTDSAFNKSASAQLNFVYRNSPYYEKEHMRYPVYRVANNK